MFKVIVLNINDMTRIGVKLWAEVTLLEIENAQHDIFLRSKTVRKKAFEEMFYFLNSIEFKK